MEKKAANKAISKKKRGPMHLIRVALFMIRGRSSKSLPGHGNVCDMEKDIWKKVVAPFQAPPPPPPPLFLEYPDSFHDVLQPPQSPPRAVQVYEDGMSSRYASAEDLHQLDQEEGDNNDDDDGRADNGIDMQAEVFIAKFYEQIRLQRLEA